MHNIHRHQIIFFLLILFTSIGFQLEAQTKQKGNYNYWEFRKKPFYFGLTLGAHSSGFLTSNSRRLIQHDSIILASGIDRPGMHVNIITNLKIGQFFDFRFIPGFAFSERRIKFEKYQTGNSSENAPLTDFERIESVFLEIPLLVRFKSVPYRDKRIFVVGGIKYSYDVASNSRARDELLSDIFRISPHDFQFEIGAGVQFFFPFFIFSPEIKYSQGIGNIHIFNGTKEESNIIDKVLSRSLQISFHFEG